MTPPILPETDEQTADWARPLYERQIAMLGDMAERGLEIVHAIRDEAVATGDAAARQSLFMAYARTARAVRLTLMLQARLIKDLEARERTLAQRASWEVVEHTLERKARVARIVARVATRDGEESEDIERLAEEACERLDQDDLHGDLLSRPLSELVAMICEDLGLDPDWPRLAEEAWARKEMEGSAVGWPLAGMGPPGSTAPPGRMSERSPPKPHRPSS